MNTFLRLLEKQNALHLELSPFSSSPQLFQNIGEFGAKNYFTDLWTATIHSFVAVKGNFSGLCFFWTSPSEGEFPRYYLINVATCLFAYKYISSDCSGFKYHLDQNAMSPPKLLHFVGRTHDPIAPLARASTQIMLVVFLNIYTNHTSCIFKRNSSQLSISTTKALAQFRKPTPPPSSS